MSPSARKPLCTFCAVTAAMPNSAVISTTDGMRVRGGIRAVLDTAADHLGHLAPAGDVGSKFHHRTTMRRRPVFCAIHSPPLMQQYTAVGCSFERPRRRIPAAPGHGHQRSRTELMTVTDLIDRLITWVGLLLTPRGTAAAPTYSRPPSSPPPLHPPGPPTPHPPRPPQPLRPGRQLPARRHRHQVRTPVPHRS